MKKISLLLLLPLLLAISCTKENLEIEQNEAFSSDGSCTVWTDDYFYEINPDVTFDFVAKIYGNTHAIQESTDANGNYFRLGFIVTENSQNPGEVYAELSPTGPWRRLNECKAQSIAGFWDTLSKNNSKKARIIQAGTNSNNVLLFFGGGSVRNYKNFRVDFGEVLKAHNQPVRTLPGGFGASTIFYHDHHRADFPPNWLGVKGKKLYTFGPNINSSPSIIAVKNNGTDINGKIRKVKGYWPHNNARIVIDRTNGPDLTVQKERNGGVNFYKN